MASTTSLSSPGSRARLRANAVAAGRAKDSAGVSRAGTSARCSRDLRPRPCRSRCRLDLIACHSIGEAAVPERIAALWRVEWWTVSAVRMCSKVSCSRPAADTMTYVHADATVVIGPLGRRAEPGAHDLCADHAAKLTPPVDWQLIRIDSGQAPPERSRDDLLAIADAVREAADSADTRAQRPESTPAADSTQTGRKHGHLRIIGDS